MGVSETEPLNRIEIARVRPARTKPSGAAVTRSGSDAVAAGSAGCESGSAGASPETGWSGARQSPR